MGNQRTEKKIGHEMETGAIYHAGGVGTGELSSHSRSMARFQNSLPAPY